MIYVKGGMGAVPFLWFCCCCYSTECHEVCRRTTQKSRASVRMWMHETVILTKARRRKHDGRNGTAHGRRAGVRWPPCTPIKERIWRTLREPRSGGTHNRTDYLYSVVDVILTVPRRRKHDGVFPSRRTMDPTLKRKTNVA